MASSRISIHEDKGIYSEGDRIPVTIGGTEVAAFEADGTGTGWTYLNKAVAARVYNSAVQAVSGMNVDTALTYDTVRYDTGTFWSNTHPTRLTVPKTGYYHVAANFVIDNPSSSNARVYLKLLVNGTTNISQKAVVLPIGTDTLIHRPVDVVTADWLLNKGDYVEAIVSPDYNTASINVQASPAQSAEFWIHLVGV